MSETIPQRELRNRVSAVLRAAEQGATYTITVDGRPVAELGPHHPRTWVHRDRLDGLWSTPSDGTWLDDVAAHSDDGLDHDPWSRP